MQLGSIQICGESLTRVEVKDIYESLKVNSIRLLSLRECIITDKDFKKLMKGLSVTTSLLQINLNLGVINHILRVEQLGKALNKNRSLNSLFLHGSPIGDHGIALLVKKLACHPHIVSLDIGDCHLTDAAIPFITELLPPNGAKKGLQDLTLSANPLITSVGWTKLFTALTASSALSSLCLDYNNIGDYGAGCLAVALPTLTTLEVLDLEGSSITNIGAKILLHAVKNYPVSLKKIILVENDIKSAIAKAIQSSLNETDDDTSTVISDIDSMTLDSDSGSSNIELFSTEAGKIITKDSSVEDRFGCSSKKSVNRPAQITLEMVAKANSKRSCLSTVDSEDSDRTDDTNTLKESGQSSDETDDSDMGEELKEVDSSERNSSYLNESQAVADAYAYALKV